MLRPDTASSPIIASAEQRAVIEHSAGRVRVLAGPGTGKTATIVEAVADRILRRGLDPSSILVLTFSRRAAAELSARIAARLDITVTGPLVRTLHSYAYALVRAAALAAGNPPPRLLQAGQADLMVREILAGHIEDGRAGWPTDVQAALRVPAFAAELREFMLRTAERQIPPKQIAALGRRMRRPEWQAAAEFITEYRDIGDLRQAASRFGAALDQAELTTAALDRLAEPTVLAAEQARIRRIFVDEYQDVDPAQASMVELLAAGADELVVVGDPDQSIYAFRGAAAGALRRVQTDETVALTTSHRMPPVLLDATRRVAAKVPGPAAHRALRAAHPHPAGTLEVRVLSSPAREAAYLADELRRAHVESGVPWSQMAVLLRSPARAADPIRRACSAAGVPVAAGTDGPVATDPLVQALLTVLRVGANPGALTPEAALGLLTSPLGGMDPLAVRRLRRALRVSPEPTAASDDPTPGGPASGGSLPGGPASGGPGSGGPAPSADRLAAILRGSTDVPAGLPADLGRPVRLLADLVRVARDGAGEPAAEDALWRVWQRSGVADRLLGDSERAGRDAAQADRMLDAAVALFDRAADLADQLPGAGVPGLLELLGGEQLPDAVGRGRTGEAVAILSAHAAKGLEWDVVAVAGVQQDAWPDLRPRASLLHLPALLDAAAGVRPGMPAADRLADERRLFYVATTRARQRLIVTAVQDDDNAPSRFLAELAGTDDLPVGWPTDRRGRPRRALHLPALVADLRRAVTTAADDERSIADADHAAAALARLADAGVPGAHPDDWYGLPEPSTDAGLVAPGAEVTLSPSQIESVLDCPLRSVLERNGARGAPSQPQLLGIAVHALAQGIAAGMTDADLAAAAEGFLSGQEHLPPWEIGRLRRMLESMTQALRSWAVVSRAEREFVGSEVDLDVRLPPGEPDASADAGPIRLVGRVDWLSTDRQGRLVITDFKSGATVPSKASVAEHAQLAVYQLAAAAGAFGPVGDEVPAGGADEVRTGGCDEVPAGGGDEVPGNAGDEALDGAADRRTALPTGGAELVYLRSGKPKTLAQPPQSPDESARWIDRLRTVAASVTGGTLTARQGNQCERCPVRSSCPLQPEGRQVVR